MSIGISGGAETDPLSLKLTGGTMTGQIVLPATGIKFSDGSVQLTANTYTGGTSPVTSVAGRVGAITLSTSDIAGMSSYPTTATANSTYQTISGMSAYLTSTTAANLYYPLGSNPSNYVQASALNSYAPLAGATFTGSVNVNIPFSIGGTGIVITHQGTGNSFVVNDSSPDSTPFVIDNNGHVGIGIAPDANRCLSLDTTGVKFADGTIQTTAYTGTAGTSAQNYSVTLSASATTQEIGYTAYNLSTQSGVGFYCQNSDSGSGFFSSNMSTGTGIYSTNSSDGYGIYSSNFGAGSGIYCNSTTGTGNSIEINGGTSFTGTSLKIINRGTGDCVRIEDSLPDSTPFVINNSGRVGIGIAPYATATQPALALDAYGMAFNGNTFNVTGTGTIPAGATYTTELRVTINGTNYGIPLRIV